MHWIISSSMKSFYSTCKQLLASLQTLTSLEYVLIFHFIFHFQVCSWWVLEKDFHHIASKLSCHCSLWVCAWRIRRREKLTLAQNLSLIFKMIGAKYKDCIIQLVTADIGSDVSIFFKLPETVFFPSYSPQCLIQTLNICKCWTKCNIINVVHDAHI